jgi:hypothetical protein
MLGFGSKKPAAKMTQAQAYEQLKQILDAAIAEARKAGVWPQTIAQLFNAHAANLDVVRR